MADSDVQRGPTVKAASGWEVKEKTWEEMQKRTFTKWVNAQLKKRGMGLESLETDFADGVNLINLYEIISDTVLGKYVRKPSLRVQKIANLNIVVPKINEFVDSVGIRVFFSPENICDGEMKFILGMIWCLIHKFTIQDVSEADLNAREGLLLWCQKKTKPYNNVKIDNFSTSWQDGLGFCALIHAHHPELIDYASLSKDNAKENLELAFRVAEEKLDIPSLLDADDMVSYKPDDKSVMTYVAQYWRKFASRQKESVAGEKIANIADRARSNEEMRNDYERRASDLIQWIEDKTDKFGDRSFGNCLEDVEPIFRSFASYKKDEKPPKTNERAELEALLGGLRLKQKNEGAPVYNPPEEISPSTLDHKWNNLGDVERVYDQELRDEYIKQKRLAVSLARFRARAAKLRSVFEEKHEYATSEPTNVSAIAQCIAALKVFEAFEAELSSFRPSLTSLATMGQEIIDAEHKAAPEVTATLAELNGASDEINAASSGLKQKLEDALALAKSIDEKSLEFATKASGVNVLCEEALMVLTDPVSSSSVAEVDALVAAINAIDERFTEGAANLEAAEAVNNDLVAAGVTTNPYTRIKAEDLRTRFDDLRAQIAARKDELSAEHGLQEQNEALVNAYNEAVTAFSAFIAAKTEEINAEQEGELEEQLEKVSSIGQAALTAAAEQFEAIKPQYTAVEEAGVDERVTVPFQNVGVLKNSLQTILKRRETDIEKLLMAKKAADITVEQLEEIKSAFAHFDKDHNKELNRYEFQACLASMGDDLTEDAVTGIMADLGLGPNDGITYDTFVSFMSKRLKKGSSKEDILDAFKVVAGDKEFVTEADLRRVMGAEQADYLITVMPKSDLGENAFDFKAYCDALYA